MIIKRFISVHYCVPHGVRVPFPGIPQKSSFKWVPKAVKKLAFSKKIGNGW